MATVSHWRGHTEKERKRESEKESASFEAAAARKNEEVLYLSPAALLQSACVLTP